MSSESEKDKERLIQAAKVFFFHIQDLVSFINRFVELFNIMMKTQILPMSVNEESCIKDFFEQMINNFKEMQLMVDGKHTQMQKEPLCSKVLTAVTSAAEKCANITPHHTAEEMLKNIQTSGAALVLKNSHILSNLETSLSLLMQFPIMGLRLSDLYREETKGQTDALTDAPTNAPTDAPTNAPTDATTNATTSEKSTSPDCPKATTEETLKKLQGVLSTENPHAPVEAAADELEQFVKTMQMTLQALQKTIKTMEGDISVLTQAQGK